MSQLINSVVVSIISTLLFLNVASESWTPSKYIAECGYSLPPSFLCDPDNILDDPTNETASQLAEINSNNTEGVIYWKEGQYVEFFYGYTIAATVVGSIEPEENETPDQSIKRFGEAVQKDWFGHRKCDNSTLVLLTLNSSKISLFPGEGSLKRMRAHHLTVCDHLHVEEGNVTDTLMACLADLDAAMEDAFRPMTNTGWGFGGVIAILAMLFFHYWIKY
ncbi:uncharacterized protein [Diadema setosum]|uniref:uncharacterized protein n=1 Tax=Diadema setosum TaxID=31175 RepID=UPI003B3A714C